MSDRFHVPPDEEFNVNDVGPGVSEAADHDVLAHIRGYAIGLGLSVLLTAASFWAVGTYQIWPPAIPVMLIALAVAQMGVHLVFFLHITSAPDNTNNVLALAFGVLIVSLIMAGSLWIMYNLNERMMPVSTSQVMQMQR